MKVRSVVCVGALGVGMLAAGLFLGGLNNGKTMTGADAKGSIYAQLSSAITQKPADDQPMLVKMESNDALSGLTHSDKEKTENVVVQVPGTYFIMAAAQVGADESGVGDGHLDLWVKVNGKDVDNSNTRQYIRDGKFTSVLVCQGIAELKTGDVVACAFAVSAPGKGLGILAIKPKGEPVIPSIIFSMYKIN